jgi:probable rRNA maturation factor
VKALRDLATAAAEIAGVGLGPDDILAVSFLGPRAIHRVNRDFLGHDDVTDVISFDYRGGVSPRSPGDVAVELLICPDLALARSCELRNVDYPGELTLYLVHGLLHAAGHDDTDPAARRRMRAAERRVMRHLRRRSSLAEVFSPPRRIHS